MNEYNEGDLVEAVKGDTVIRGPLVYICGLGRSLCLKLTLGIETDIIHLEANGYTVTTIEKAPPKVVLPIEPGLYTTDTRDLARSVPLYRLTENGKWSTIWPHQGEQTRTPAEILDGIEPETLTRLEPVPETAKKVLDRVRTYWDFQPPFNVGLALDIIAKDFGVPA